MSGGLVTRQLVDGVAVVSLNRPEKHNAFNDELSHEWRAGLTWAIDDAAARCILLRGEGPSFSSGRDTTQLGDRPPGVSDHEFVRQAQAVPRRLAACPKPVVAALKGWVLGAAFEIALRADFRIAAPDIRLGLPEVAFGIVPDTGGTQTLTSLVGPSRAKWVIMTGARIGAEDALAWGLVNEVVAFDMLDDRALEVARALASGPPLALATAKRLVDEAWADVVRRGTDHELVAQTSLFSSADYAEAKAARREGRPPRFEGR